MPRKYSFANAFKNEQSEETCSVIDTEVKENNDELGNKSSASEKDRRSYSFRRSLSGGSDGVKSIKNAFGAWRGTIKQKMKLPVKHKRLVNATTPTNPHTRLLTPPSYKKSSSKRDVKMYSPFAIDSPSKTPRRIRMGTAFARRCNESPGLLSQLQATTTAMSSLNHSSPGPSRIRTTPRCVKSVKNLLK